MYDAIRPFARSFEFTEETDSTNTSIKNRIRASDGPVFDVIAADRQRSGRGRSGRSFFSPAGGVYFSAAYPLCGAEENPAFLSLLAGLAAAEALEALCGAKVRIKWPNDLYLNGKKLAGILTELVSERQTAVVGVGINAAQTAFPPELRETATSLAGEGFVPPGRERLIREILARTDRWVYEEGALLRQDGRFSARINERAFLTGRRVTRTAGGETVSGTALRIEPDGALAVLTDGGDVCRITFGEVLF